MAWPDLFADSVLSTQHMCGRRVQHGEPMGVGFVPVQRVNLGKLTVYGLPAFSLPLLSVRMVVAGGRMSHPHLARHRATRAGFIVLLGFCANSISSG